MKKIFIYTEATMNYIKIMPLFILFFISCNEIVNNESEKEGADAGEDQTTYIGSYVVIDISNSMLPEGETINLIEWTQDAGNPQEIYLFAQSSLNDKWIVSFEKEGRYKYTLNIECNSGNVFTDDVVITVNPRQPSVIEDIYLEARIRYELSYKEGELNAGKLQMLDSLPASDVVMKNYKTKSIQGIENCTNLIYLALGLQSITDLAPLADLTKLEYLDLSQNRTIEDISPLTNLVNLKKLILDTNPIKDISALGNLTNLKELWLWFTPITNLNPLSSLSNLEILHLSGVGEGITFESIEPLRNLLNLKQLDLSGGNITDITPLENLTELILLDVGYNNLTEISPVSKMKKLIRLYIRLNKINDISGIKNLESLDYLDAADNEIKDISELQYLPNIHLIGLSRNQIEDILPLVNNANLGKGVYLYLDGNPLNEKSVNEYIPALQARGVSVFY